MPATASIVNNTFAHNRVDAPATRSRQGGGLWIGIGLHLAPAARSEITQSGNTFDSNSITGTAGNYSGAGENVVGANVTSVGDRFIANTLPGPTLANKDSQGAGLALFGGGSCSTPGDATSQFTNLVATGNTIAAPTAPGTGATVEGAGIYVGCSVSGGSSHLTLTNSTVTANTVSGTGAVGGIDGETNDSLILQNSIVFGDSGAELDGFGPTAGANVTATFSDVCAIGSATSPFAGTGNVCTSPASVNGAAGDVHETPASPTIDAGSNALVPGSVATDFFGGPRIVPGRLGDAAIVDIGAAEFVPVPVNAGLPVISGTPVKGQTLRRRTEAGTASRMRSDITGRTATRPGTRARTFPGRSPVRTPLLAVTSATRFASSSQRPTSAVRRRRRRRRPPPSPHRRHHRRRPCGRRC